MNLPVLFQTSLYIDNSPTNVNAKTICIYIYIYMKAVSGIGTSCNWRNWQNWFKPDIFYFKILENISSFYNFQIRRYQAHIEFGFTIFDFYQLNSEISIVLKTPLSILGPSQYKSRFDNGEAVSKSAWCDLRLGMSSES